MSLKTRILVSVAFIFFVSFSRAENFDQLIQLRAEQAKVHLWSNISRIDTLKGFIVASPTKYDPNYYYHWVRDAALTMRSIGIWEGGWKEGSKNFQQLINFEELETKNQNVFKLSDQGEPKFNPNGTSYQGPWGRPQNDGPALRSSFFAEFAISRFFSGDKKWLQKWYEPQLPAKSLLKIDFEYISHHWQKADFDLWEETQGQNFYTRMVQWKALSNASKVAALMKDSSASIWYAEQAKLVEKSLFAHLGRDQIIKATVNRVGGLGTKLSQLDSSVILAVLHTDRLDGAFGLNSEPIIKTFLTLDETFKKLYKINSSETIQKQKFLKKVDDVFDFPKLGNAIGRYPEDSFYGGNPWFLLTSAFAEFCYRQAMLINADRSRTRLMQNFNMGQKTKNLLMSFLNLNSLDNPHLVAKAWSNKGDEYLARVIFHTDLNGHQAEQIDKNSGYFTSAKDLTWSYAAYLTAVKHRKILKSRIK